MIKSKLQKLSLVAALVVTSSAFSADTIKDAFKEGTPSGSLTVYGISTDAKGGTADSGFTSGTAQLSFETAAVSGVSAKMSFLAGTDFSEVESGDSGYTETSLMTEAYIKYANDDFFAVAGRQAIDLEWLGDFNEGLVLGLTSIPDTTIVAGYTARQAAADEDEIGTFTRTNSDKGAYVLDVKYSGVERLELNPYFYSAEDVADFYGLKATYTAEAFGLTAQYAASSEDTQKDGDIAHIEASTEVAGLSIAAGYITTNKDVGTGSIDAFGDNISPFDNGANTYAANADTYYASLGYSVAGVDLGLLYGETEFSTSSEETELNISADYAISEELSLGLLYVDYDLEGSASSDYNSISATIAYSF